MALGGPVLSDVGHSERDIAHKGSQLCYADESLESFSLESCEEFQCLDFVANLVVSQVCVPSSNIACIESPP